MKCYDDINQRYGNGTVEVASAGLVEQWGMRRNFLSPRYTSKWQDIPKISC
jgi:DNA polymerase V